jgi:hypothetical protein
MGVSLSVLFSAGKIASLKVIHRSFSETCRQLVSGNLAVARSADSKSIDDGEESVKAGVLLGSLGCFRVDRCNAATTHWSVRQRHHERITTSLEFGRQRLRRVRRGKTELPVADGRRSQPSHAMLETIANLEPIDAAYPTLLLEQAEREEARNGLGDPTLGHAQLARERA